MDAKDAQKISPSRKVSHGSNGPPIADDLDGRRCDDVVPEAYPATDVVAGSCPAIGRDQISGAPVVDENGRCVGVLSTTDYLRWVDHNGRPAGERRDNRECVCAWQLINVESLPDDAVSLWMTSDLVTANPDTCICDLARAMTDAHIHRVVVVDGRWRPIGVVSSTDILAAVARVNSATTNIDCSSQPLLN
jgi:CBS-domain-containing membrane protein